MKYEKMDIEQYMNLIRKTRDRFIDKGLCLAEAEKATWLKFNGPQRLAKVLANPDLDDWNRAVIEKMGEHPVAWYDRLLNEIRFQEHFI